MRHPDDQPAGLQGRLHRCLLRALSLLPRLAVSALITLIATELLDQPARTLTRLGIVAVLVTSWTGLTDDLVLRIAHRGRSPHPAEFAALAPVLAAVGEEHPLPHRILIVQRLHSPCRTAGRHHLLLHHDYVNHLRAATLPHHDAAALLLHGVVHHHLIPARHYPIWLLALLPWRIAATTARIAAAPLTSHPAIRTLLTLRGVLCGVAAWQASQGHRPELAGWIVVVGTLSYLTPWADSIWERRIPPTDSHSLTFTIPHPRGHSL